MGFRIRNVEVSDPNSHGGQPYRFVAEPGDLEVRIRCYNAADGSANPLLIGGVSIDDGSFTAPSGELTTQVKAGDELILSGDGIALNSTLDIIVRTI